MTVPIRGDAAIRYTEAGQSALHYLGGPLRNPRANPVQQTHRWDSADLTTRRVVSIGAGVQDLECTLPWDGLPDPLLRMVAAGRRGATFDIFPSVADPSLSFPCIMVEAGDIQPDPQFWHARRFTVDARFRRIDGGSWQALLEAPLFYYRAGGQARGLTFTRSGAVGPYTDSDGLLKSAAANVWRTEWLWRDGTYVGAPDTPALLVEAARTNLNTDDNLNNWTSDVTPVVTSGISDPSGGTGAYNVEDNDNTFTEAKFRTVTFTGNGVKGVVFTVRQATMPGTGNQSLVLYDSTAATDRARLDISGWVNGEPTVIASAGTFIGKRPAGNGYWSLYATGTVTAANTNQLWIIPAATGSAQGSIDVFQPNASNVANSGWSILAASQTRNADTWYAAFDRVPQPMTVYVRFIEAGTIDITGGSILFIGSAASADPRFIVESNGTFYQAHHDPATISTSVLAAAPVWGDQVELAVTLAANGTPTIYQSVNGGSVATGTGGTAQPLAAAWSAPRIYLGSQGGAQAGLNPILAVKVASGVRTLAEMRAL